MNEYCKANSCKTDSICSSEKSLCDAPQISLRERFLSQFVANFNMRRMLAIYTTDSLDETVCSKSRDKRR